MRTLRLYLLMVTVAIKARMQYRSDFFVGIISVLMLNWINIAMIYVMVARFRTLQGWLFWELVMLYGMWLSSHSIYAVFCWHFSFLEDDILSGRFDQYMIRPVSPMVQFISREVNYMGVADAVLAASFLALAYQNLGLSFEPWKWGFFAVSIVAGFILEASLHLTFGAISFWTGRSRAVAQLMMTFNITVQQYPLDVFGRWFRVFVTGFLPVAFMNYWPLTVLLDKPVNPVIGFLSPAVAAAVASIAAFAWSRGLRAYSSTGN